MTVTEPEGEVAFQPSDRYGRLTFSSFDAGGVGGWQVKQHQGLLDGEVDLLRSRITTQLDLGYELPRFPSPQEVNGLPRRLVYGPVGQGAAWWHTAPAGNDASGRPGNVFVHVVLDRHPDLGRTVRPIDLWRSASWLAPFGAEGVIAAELPPGAEPLPGDAVTLDSVVDFVLDLGHFRLGTLGALLDAVASALRGGPRVVLATESVDSAAMWVGAISYLMPAQFARSEFFFSTHERSSSVRRAFEHGVHLACVPMQDVDGFSPDGNWFVIDEVEITEIGDLGGRPHRTSRGFETPATEWAAMAQVVLTEPGSARLDLQEMDALLGPLLRIGNEPAWGLATLVSMYPDRLRDAGEEAARVCSRSSPDELPDALYRQASNLLDTHTGESAASAWTYLSALHDGEVWAATGAMGQVLLGVYASRAVGDQNWFTAATPPPEPPPWKIREPTANLVVVRAKQMLTELGQAATDPAGPVAIARFIGLVGSWKLGHHDLDGLFSDALRRHVVERLLAPDAAEFVDRVGPLPETVLGRVVRPTVAAHLETCSAVPGSLLGLAALRWLYPRRSEPVLIESSLDLADWRLRAELAANLVLRKPESGRFAAERPLGLWASLRVAADLGYLPPNLDAYFVGPPWASRDLLVLEQTFPGMIPVAWLDRSVMAAPSSAELTELTRLLTARADLGAGISAESTVALATLRRDLSTEPWFHRRGREFDDALDLLLSTAAHAVSRVRAHFPSDVMDAVCAAAIVAGVLGRHDTELTVLEPATAPLQNGVPESTRSMLAEALTSNVSNILVAFVAISADHRFPEPALRVGHAVWLDSWHVHDHSTSLPVLQDFLVSTIPAEDLIVADPVLDYIWTLLYNRVPNPERSMRTMERFVGSWLRQLRRTGLARMGRADT